VSWFIANILLCFDLVRGLVTLSLTGCLMVTGVIVYSAMQPTRPLLIRYEDGALIPVYGWAFWLVFASGECFVQVGLVSVAFGFGMPPNAAFCIFTGPPTQCRGRLVTLAGVCRRLSSSVTHHGGPASGFTRAGQAMTSRRLQSNYSSTVTLHGGPVVLHPVRATPCLGCRPDQDIDCKTI